MLEIQAFFENLQGVVCAKSGERHISAETKVVV